MNLRTLVVDDTVTYRKILSDVLLKIPEIELVGTAPSGSIALKKIGVENIQLVLLDVHMPDMDGVETLRRIRGDFPAVSVVMVSGISTRGAETTIKALELGAVDFIRKPDGSDASANASQLQNDVSAVIRLVRLKQISAGGASKGAPAAAPAAVQNAERPRISTPPPPRSFAVLAIGVSTGGPEALSKLVPAFSGPLPVPILCVQHMPPMFTKSLADSLAKKSTFPVVEASDGEEIHNGTMYLAPGGRHMVVRQRDGKNVIGLNDEPPENSCRPAVDVLFRSVASVYGDRGVLSAVLTGMGSDGCAGVRTLKRRGCLCITQSEGSCVVYGMPRAVDEAGLSDKSLPLEQISGEIETLLRKGRL